MKSATKSRATSAPPSKWTVEERWKIVDKYREKIKRDDDSLPDGLSETWAAIKAIAPSDPLIDWSDPNRHAVEPLHALFGMIRVGEYPPPELLLGLERMFEEYLNAKGNVTLEQAFFGTPTRKTGNYAGRLASRKYGLLLAVMRALMDRECSAENAAENALKRLRKSREKLLMAEGMTAQNAAVEVSREMPSVDTLVSYERKHRTNKPVNRPVQPKK